MPDLLRQQLLDTSRGRIVALLQAGGATADDLASRLGITRSAVRVQLAAMERDGVVRRAGKKPGTTRPSYVFELTPELAQSLSKAYVPLLTELVGAIAESLPAHQLHSLLRRAGKRLADQLLRGRRPAGDLRSRVQMASELMNSQLGARTRVESNGSHIIHGTGCPLAALTSRQPEACRVIQALLTELVAAPVRECCEHNGQPHCRFEIRKVRSQLRSKRG
jgi:predicted ArsR family transcriptional regulator